MQPTREQIKKAEKLALNSKWNNDDYDDYEENIKRLVKLISQALADERERAVRECADILDDYDDCAKTTSFEAVETCRNLILMKISPLPPARPDKGGDSGQV